MAAKRREFATVHSGATFKHLAAYFFDPAVTAGNIENFMGVAQVPIGLAGPPHLPLGGPASLQSHTVVNRTKQDLPAPVKHMTIGVQHDPGLSLPKPVNSVEYKETHPVYSPGELSYPAWATPRQ